MNNPQLIEAVTKLAEEFHRIEKKAHNPDSVISSITITLDKLQFAVSNELEVSSQIRDGLNKACAVAVRTFEGSGIDEDLFALKVLLVDYRPS